MGKDRILAHIPTTASTEKYLENDAIYLFTVQMKSSKSRESVCAQDYTAN